MRWLHPIILVIVGGCVETSVDHALTPTCLSAGGTYASVSFTDEAATNTLDFVDKASATELGGVSGLSTSSLLALVDARPFAGADDPVAELALLVEPDELYALRLEARESWCRQDDGRQSCCVDLQCDGLGGFSGELQLNDAQAFVVLEWANGADRETLEAVCGVGSSIADAIVDARPLRSVLELDQVTWVGPSAVGSMLGLEGHGCDVQGSVYDVWCSQSGTCVCE